MRSIGPMKAAKIGYITMSILLCVLGVLLIVYPQISVSVVGRVLGIMMIVFGSVKIAGYFSKDLFRLAFQYDLALGILIIALGVLILSEPDNFMSFLSTVISVCILADGMFKIQIAIDAKRFGIAQWWLILVLAVLTGTIGCVLLFMPEGSAAVMMVLVGVSLLTEGVLNMSVALCTVKIIKNQRPDVIEIDDFEERKD